MVSLVFVFWMLVILFGIIGIFRGWAKELLVFFSVILSLTVNLLLRLYIPGVNNLNADDLTLFWIRVVILSTLVYFGYQTVSLPRFASKATREKLQDSLLGFILGAFNGYLVVGAVWFYMAEAGYPFEYIKAPVPGTVEGDAALSLLPLLSPNLLGVPWIFFAVTIAFIFVMVVFI